MNYFLVLIIIGVAGYAYYQHNQDELQVTDLQQQVDELKAKHGSAAPGETAEAVPSNDATSPSPVHPVVTISPAVKVVVPDNSHSSAIDAAAQAATAAATSDANSLGTLTTLDGRTFTNCKVLKVESDGVTFSHDEGITKVLYPLLPPNVQKQFGYDPKQAVAQADAQVRVDQAQTMSTAPATTSPTTPPANP